MHHLPTGTITFLFTDIEGSTKLWQQQPGKMAACLARHDTLLREAIQKSNGVVFKTIGDAFCAAFATAPDALAAAVDAQLSLSEETWEEETPIRVRMALHAGIAEERDSDYFGPVLNRVARLLAAGHGGQTLVSAAAYELMRDHLPEDVSLGDLGLHRLKDLERPEAVYELRHAGLVDAFPPLRSLDSIPNNLPRQPTSFIGRERVMADVTELLGKTGLLTLTGSGGSGKTRLSLQIAADVLDAYEDGAWLVELAPLTEPSLVAQTVAQVLGVKEQAGQGIQQTLAAQLKSRELLLVLDNCEHLLSACAGLVTTLLRSCPGVRVIATSQEAFGVAGEQVYRVPPLSMPDPKRSGIATPESVSQYEAVRLFIERALLVKTDFAVTNGNAPALAQLCARLDGIPLAIELAAARVRSLSVEDINKRLDSRFRLLTGGSRSALPRQQTLRALVDWSYDLLSQSEKVLLARLSVFAGGWTMAAAESICGFDPIEEFEVLDILTSLLDKSLLLAEEEGGTARYRMLETLRQYATEKRDANGETERLCRRHRDWFVALAEEAKSHLQGAEQFVWLARLEAEHDNLRAALDSYATDAERGETDDPGTRLSGALWRFWAVRGYFAEGRQYLTKALGRAHGRTRTARMERARALSGAGVLASGQSDYRGAKSLSEESLAISRELEDSQGIASSLAGLGNVAYFQGELDVAKALLEESLALFRAVTDRQGIAYSLGYLGNIAYTEGDFPAARSLIEESLAIRRELGNKLGVAYSLAGLANIASSREDFAAAWSLTEESLAIFRESGDKYGIASSLGNLGETASSQGNHLSAWSLHLESLAISRELGNKRGIASSLEGLAGASLGCADAGKAAVLFAAAHALREQIGAPLTRDEQVDQQRRIDQARAALTPSGEDAFAAAWEQGYAMNGEQAVAFAIKGRP